MIQVLEANEMDYIANVLAQRPWGEVNGLMMKLQRQANDPIIQSMRVPAAVEAPPAPAATPAPAGG